MESRTDTSCFARRPGPGGAPGPGHNGPPEEGFRGRVLAWRQAKAALRPPPLSPIQLRVRMARAEELGLAYAQYGAIRMATGRDPRALMFSPQGLGLRLKRRIEIPEAALAKLMRVRQCHLLALAPEGEAAAAFLAELREVTGLPFAGCAASPARDAGWGATRRALLPALTGLSLPGGSTVVIGAEAGPEPGWAAALGQPFLSGAAYFGA